MRQAGLVDDVDGASVGMGAQGSGRDAVDVHGLFLCTGGGMMLVDDAVYDIVTAALSSRKSGPENCPVSCFEIGKISRCCRFIRKKR